MFKSIPGNCEPIWTKLLFFLLEWPRKLYENSFRQFSFYLLIANFWMKSVKIGIIDGILTQMKSACTAHMASALGDYYLMMLPAAVIPNWDIARLQLTKVRKWWWWWCCLFWLPLASANYNNRNRRDLHVTHQWQWACCPEARAPLSQSAAFCSSLSLFSFICYHLVTWTSSAFSRQYQNQTIPLSLSSILLSSSSQVGCYCRQLHD